MYPPASLQTNWAAATYLGCAPQVAAAGQERNGWGDIHIYMYVSVQVASFSRESLRSPSPMS